MSKRYKFDDIAKEIDSRYTWTYEAGYITFFRRKDYYSQDRFMTLAFDPASRLSSIEMLKTINALCQALSDLEYTKSKVNLSKEKSKGE